MTNKKLIISQTLTGLIEKDYYEAIEKDVVPEDTTFKEYCNMAWVKEGIQELYEDLKQDTYQN